jgi:hypothetical protein
VPYDPRVSMVGAENRCYVTCYLDSLLFAMFAKMDAFECILKNNFPADDPKGKLVNLLRIWVNMLRSGKLVRADLVSGIGGTFVGMEANIMQMELIQNALAECGWTDAAEIEQQDTSEAFAFLTETLQLPLLSLQVDLFHHGKKDKDDHKVVYERLLNLAVPPDTGGKGIKLEDCLEEYFNSKVDVLRDSEEAKKSGVDDIVDNLPSLASRNTIRIVTEDSRASTVMTSSPVTLTPATITPTLPKLPEPQGEDTVTLQRIDPVEGSSTEPTQSDDKPIQERRPTNRHRSTSVIQNVLLDDSLRRSETTDSTRRARRKGSTVVKAVTIPAWQFFRLIRKDNCLFSLSYTTHEEPENSNTCAAWHAVTQNDPANDSEVAMNFDQRPVVGICLKRYTMTEQGQPRRHNTYIDIPDSLRLPHFMLADGSTDDEAETEDEECVQRLETDYKLVLQSVVCHRGESVQAGHYIAFARVAPKLLTGNRRHEFDPPPDYEEAVWVRFDDLNVENRVTYVEDIKEALKSEMPYLLFYQVMPMRDNPAASDTEPEPEPPSYEDFRASVEASRSSIVTPPEKTRHSGFFQERNLPTPPEFSTTTSPNHPPSLRFSADYDRPRMSQELNLGDHRRSINWGGSGAASPSLTSEGNQSPLLNPVDDSTASRLSRAAARFTSMGKQSRPASQTGEGRISNAMSRMTGLVMRPSREPLTDLNGLSRSTNSSAGRLSVETPRTEKDTLLVADENATPRRHASQRHPHKPNGKSKERGKSRERGKGKEKEKELAIEAAKNSTDQPERECTVM